MGNSGKLRTFAVLLTLMLVLPVLSACLGGSTTPTPTVPTNANADLLKKAIANMMQLKSYYISATVDGSKPTSELSGEVDVSGNKSRLAVNNGGTKLEVISVGRTAYISENSSPGYRSAPVDDLNLDDILGIWQRFKPEDIDKTADSLKDGTPATETIDGVFTKHIVGDAAELNAVTDPGNVTGQVGSVEFWISPGETPYVHRMKVDIRTPGEETTGTFNWSRFNETFDIKAPAGE